MNAKQAKRIRRSIQQAVLEATGVPVSALDKQLNCHLVDSKRFNTTTTAQDGHKEEHQGKALQWVLDPASPKGIYKRVKKRVQTIRREKRAGLLSELRDRIRRGIAGAVEHARAASIQRQYEAVPGLQGLGIQDSAQGKGSNT